MTHVIRFEAVTKRYDATGPTALDQMSLTVGEREAVAVMGPSGSGKSTLPNLIAGLDRPTSSSTCSTTAERPDCKQGETPDGQPQENSDVDRNCPHRFVRRDAAWRRQGDVRNSPDCHDFHHGSTGQAAQAPPLGSSRIDLCCIRGCGMERIHHRPSESFDWGGDELRQ
ncbi:ATP-binding cassette domain-containing protein [Streptomyces sp. NPDC020607]|uniref:ATP-binding cassette domain-containing protein n=1 Tax=Streptomyces sp. NPDC020607 TaxID=3365082 RepID=UPI003787C4B2